MAPHGFHGGVAVHPGGEAGTGGHYHRRVGDCGAQVALGQDGVHHPGGVQLPDARAFRVCQHGYLPTLRQGKGFLRTAGQHGFHILHRAAAVPDGLGKADGAADRGGLGQVRQDQAVPGPVEPQGDAGGNVSGASDDDQHSITPLMVFPPQRPNGRHVHRSAPRRC